ncbi:MAG: glycosyltransferase, partial [Candidatus Sumerlaeota bacterium]|nr:glycosyltransferase [Candidatus Sumerlaeota bacterium]
AAPWPVLTVVVHFRTPDDPGEWIAREFPWARMAWTDRFGIAHMRNAGLAAAAEARHKLILDIDAELRPGALEALVEFLESDARIAVAGSRTLRPDGSMEWNAKRFYDWMTIAVRRSPLQRLWPGNPWTRRHLMLDVDHSRPFECDWVAGACMLLRGEAVAEVGSFDERYRFGFEDVDWCLRAKKLGWKVCYCPRAEIVHHVQRRSARDLNALTIEHLKSLWRFWRKHGRLGL